MKQIVIALMMLITVGCAHRNPLSEMRFQTVMAPPYVIATWYKITDVGQPVKFYIEGWGHDHYPNPDSELMRDMAKQDTAPNVVYIALPCQYGVHVGCSLNEPMQMNQTVVNSIQTVVQNMMKKAQANRMILIGYDVGAEVASELAVTYQPSVSHLVSIGGIWQKEPAQKIVRLAQTHYRGERDSIAPIEDTPAIFPKESVVPVAWGSHTGGYWSIRKYIWNIR